MSDTVNLKRFISTTSVTGSIYSGSRSKAVKTYLEQEGLKSWADASPALNEAGAETVEVVWVIDGLDNLLPLADWHSSTVHQAIKVAPLARNLSI